MGPEPGKEAISVKNMFTRRFGTLPNFFEADAARFNLIDVHCEGNVVGCGGVWWDVVVCDAGGGMW